MEVLTLIVSLVIVALLLLPRILKSKKKNRPQNSCGSCTNCDMNHTQTIKENDEKK